MVTALSVPLPQPNLRAKCILDIGDSPFTQVSLLFVTKFSTPNEEQLPTHPSLIY